MIFSQIFDMLDAGIVILDKDLRVSKWNRWMSTHSDIHSERIIGKPLFNFYPELNEPWFLRNCKSVFTFGNFAFLSYKLHNYCFPFKSYNSLGYDFEYMQQNCTVGPLRNDDNNIDYIYITVIDVTEVASYEQKLIEMNTRDGLTDIYNRRFFDTRIEEEFVRHKRYSRPMSMIMLDIDFFKKANDTYGHQAGDFILISLTKLITDRLRKTDIFCRYGGEEFCCILPETTIDSANSLAEELLNAVFSHTFVFNKININITISLGISVLDDDINSAETLLKKADDALYQAKQEGRNQVVVASS
ncbi:MAG: diguanylate cyclase [Deltaproteobacteria bacterium]|nr:diguanylate cyclase [Deltaproteobacteria bacterium]MBW2217915.1 diguanylate cyclase [Deltaproteobacteria bacterium]